MSVNLVTLSDNRNVWTVQFIIIIIIIIIRLYCILCGRDQKKKSTFISILYTCLHASKAEGVLYLPSVLYFP